MPAPTTTSPSFSGSGRTARWRGAAALIACLWTISVSAAEVFPARPVRMMIPFPAGGPADFVGRLFSQHLTELWGVQVVTDNRGGASGIIGTDIAVRSNPDGYTLLFGSTSTFAVNLVLINKLPYDVFRDLALIGLVANAPHVLAVRESLPAKNVKELIALAKRQPGKYSFASAGTGTIVHMGGELFKYHAGIDILHVPFKGGAPATTGLLAGEVDMVVNDLSAVLAHVKSGKLRALGAAHTKRLAPLPAVPTFTELGMPGIVSSTWWGIAVPAKTPAAVRARITETHNKVLARPAYVERLADLAMEPLVLTPEQTTAFIKREIAKWRQVATAANVRIE
ncbi:MAG: tripartite tricarboxylate transporter substrate binding protein [Pseudomonadota bacterium]